MNLNQVTIYSNKPAESIEFYQKLGLHLIVDSAPRYVRFECPDGDSTLSIHQTDENSANSNIVLYFECKNLDEDFARLKASGLVFATEPTDQSWLWRETSLKDPTGNKIILFYAGENRKNPPWKIQTKLLS